jgi:two-component system response regulator HydG
MKSPFWFGAIRRPIFRTPEEKGPDLATILGRGTVLVVDADAARASEVGRSIGSAGYNVLTEASGRSALRRVHSRSVNVLLVASELPDMVMGTFLDALRKANLSAGVVIYGSGVQAEDAISWMRGGVVDVLLDVSDTMRLRDAVSLAFSHSARSAAQSSPVGPGASEEPPLLYRTRVMDELMSRARRVAPVKATVLITGESGTGKEILARQIHALSGRKGPYLALNCAAIPETLLEDELFGHERGAFTGAEKMREGRFEAAAGGTLLLDEIGDIPAATQVKLLRALEEEQITRLGGNHPISTDVRLISATNSDLTARVRTGTFREDLYYRLKVVELQIPPLRARRQDIPLLIMAFLRQGSEKHGLPLPVVEQDALEMLTSFGWPGNVRQLRNTVESLLITSGDRIRAADLPKEIAGVTPGSVETLTIDLPVKLEEIEKLVIDRTLSLAGGNRTRAAELLGMGRRTLQRKLGGSG